MFTLNYLTTIIKKLDLLNQANFDITLKTASDIIKSGGIVAFPTETVYGLGANAFDIDSIKKIYIAKGRPSDNPLIIHVAQIQTVYDLAQNLSKNAIKLMNYFWPGPLTLILNKKKCIPDIVTCGLDTVAIRFPKNQIALELIKLSKTPIAAPSANSSGKPSPTNAFHVIEDLDGKIDMILDGGTCSIGLESTVIDATTENISIIRPGFVTKEMLISVIDSMFIKSFSSENENTLDSTPISPGLKYRHYAPNAQLKLVCGDLEQIIKKINFLVLHDKFLNIAIMATDQTQNFYDKTKYLVISLGDRKNLDTIANNLFDVLRKLDYHNIDVIYCEGFDENFFGVAIMNRLKKASGYNIIKC